MSNMSANLPTISVTADKPDQTELSDDESDYSNDMDYNQNEGGVTDVEDFDSQAEVLLRKSPNNIVKENANVDNDATDIEDYNDSGSEDEEKSNIYPELKISLREFLQQGLQEQEFVDNEAKESVDFRAGDFLQAQNLNNVSDYLTDCEDYNTDSEIDGNYEKSVCVNLDSVADNQGRVCITDDAKLEKVENEGEDDDDDDNDDDVSAFSDVSNLAFALSDAIGATGGVDVRFGVEDELQLTSGDEEECQIVYSASDTDEDKNCEGATNACLPAVDVKFVRANVKRNNASGTALTKSNKPFLAVCPINDEVLTDVERLEDSAAENDSFDNEDDNEKPIPRAIILAPGDDGACQTDVEDILCEDSLPTSSTVSEPLVVATNLLPPSQREMVTLKEDKFGDTKTSVMPMDKDFQFGIYNNFKDDDLTDSEDISCAEDYGRKQSIAVEILTANAEGEHTVFNEVLKPTVSKRTEMHSNTESVTDVEEIYVAGTNRRKKLKTRSASKNKTKFLDVATVVDGATDVEEMELSENGLPPNVKRSAVTKQSKQNATDIEDITADEASDVSDTEAPQINANTPALKHYEENSANVVLTQESDAAKASAKYEKTNINTLRLNMQKDDHISQLTDTEDIQLASDGEEWVSAEKESNGACSEFNDMLNESYTVVHEKTGSTFNVDREKLHVKNINELTEAHTDIEYVESDEPTAREGN